MKLFAVNLKKAIAESDMSAYELAKKMDVDRNTVYFYTSGRALPSVSVLAKIRRLLNADANTLLGLVK